MKAMTVFMSVLAVTLLTACASARQAEQKQKEALARYQPYLGETVSQYNRYTRSDGWTPVDNEHIVVRTNVNDAYLLTVAPPCMNLPFAGVGIGVTERFPNVVASGFDSIRVRGERCLILKIQKVDYKRMQADLKDLKAEKKSAT
ncbi:MAG: DUF6491 family protein [Gammaproteobacteria bacterium]